MSPSRKVAASSSSLGKEAANRERGRLLFAVLVAVLVGVLLGLMVHLQPEGGSRAAWPDQPPSKSP